MMEQQVLRIAREVAISSAYEAGRVIRDRFGMLNQAREKDEHGDLVTEADHKAEAVILHKIQSVFPGHRIQSEEAGEIAAESEWTWLVDPLDGTNNYAVGLPLFAVSITLVHRQSPVLAVIYEPMTERLYVAATGEGATCNGNGLEIGERGPLAKARVGWIQGHLVQQDRKAARLRHHIEANSKRLMRLWAPTLQWTMLARGDLDGIIVFNSEGEDLYSGLLVVQEAGGIVMDFEGHPFTGTGGQPYLIACRSEHRAYFLDLVREGLNEQ
ncbi:inositol monophosphatase family protein [Paenibacillus harenae]|uniref:inositol monophosphatase family protein n=1 Tax=Paenibacillus harenae TaxID=306543 RepID=UPI0027D7C27E|nr:inositol monophosphatase [Paenibacillus harenae]